MVQAFWIARIRHDAANERAKSISEYLEELLPPEEQFERSMDRMFARLDDAVARREAREARKQANDDNEGG